jgi:integrase
MQPRLFDLPVPRPSRPPAKRLDADSEALLGRFGAQRLAGGGLARTVAREVSQLRSLGRQGAARRPAALRGLLTDPNALADALLQPPRPISVSTGRIRLLAVQRIIGACGHEIGIADADGFLASLDALLPARTAHDWHAAGTIVAGVRTRQRPRCPTLYPADLERVLAVAGAGAGKRALRDRALVALHCYSGLRPEEVGRLRRTDVLSVDDGCHVVEVRRASGLMRLALPAASAEPLIDLIRSQSEAENVADSTILFRCGTAKQPPLSSRAVRLIVQAACKRAGFPSATAVDLRAGFAYWLRARGLSDHEAAQVLGLKRVKTLDQLLKRHEALDAQRRIREFSRAQPW